MANSSSSSSSGGIGFVGLLTIVFITLKLIGKITWSWVWVLSPIWISAAVGGIVIGGFLGLAFVVAVLDSNEKTRTLGDSRQRLGLGARRTTGRVIDVERKKDDKFLH